MIIVWAIVYTQTIRVGRQAVHPYWPGFAWLGMLALTWAGVAVSIAHDFKSLAVIRPDALDRRGRCDAGVGQPVAALMGAAYGLFILQRLTLSRPVLHLVMVLPLLALATAPWQLGSEQAAIARLDPGSR